MPTLLDGIRVLDLTNERGEMAGRILSDMGAEVLKIEPPEGANARRLPPFESDDEAKPSLYWAAVGLGKKSAVLDFLNDEGDRGRLRDLAAVSDILIESFHPGTLPALGLGQEDLRALNPRLIYVSVTPYGQEGPKAHWPVSDLVVQSVGGRTALQGDHDRPPVPVGFPHQGYFAGSATAAADAVIALNEREQSGLGQYLDTSMQECMIWSHLYVHGWPTHTGHDPSGIGDDRNTGKTTPAGIAPGAACKDGYLLAPTNPIQMGNIATRRIIPALERGGVLPEALKQIDWEKFNEDVAEGRASQEIIQTIASSIKDLLLTRTKKEWMDFAVQNGLYWAPINTTKDLVESEQLKARDYWQKVGPYLHPGPHAKLSRTPIVLEDPAPALGEHQSLIDEWLKDSPKAPEPRIEVKDRLAEAFRGIKIADFTWIATGPVTTKAMADHGAIVVKIESEVRPDSTRLSGPFRDDKNGLNRSFHFTNWNTSKFDVGLNTSKPEGKALARRIIDWADVVVDNYSAGQMVRMGFDYETLSKDHPDLIMMSSCLLGQTGPWRDFSGGGSQGAALAGFHALTGWPDRSPTGPHGAYTDLLSARYSIATLAAAILERRRTGRGQYIDNGQVEAGMHFMEPLLLDQTVNGRTSPAWALDSDVGCPNGTYPVQGIERYIAISVETPEQWRALRSLAPLDAFADGRYDDISVRRKAKDEIDRAIASWTEGFDRFELERMLAEAGVPAGVVARPSDMQMDVQLKSRGFFLTLDHPEMGPSHYDAFATQFSAIKKMPHRRAPCLGEHTHYVLSELLGMSEEEITEYAAIDVLR